MVTFQTTLVERDSDGALFVRYTPVLKSECGIQGELRFPFWDVGVGESVLEHHRAKAAAKANAVTVLRRLAETV